MKITILGSGTSTGVPEIGCTCSVCTSSNPKDKRLRTSALIQTAGTNLLIDCGPDFRQQMLALPFTKLHGVLITHEHYDHVGGLDDLRPFCRLGKVSVYAEAYMTEKLRHRIPYCFATQKYPGVPDISLVDIDPSIPFRINGVEIIPIRVIHGKLPILGYRIGKLAYITDMLTLPPEEYEKLQGLDCLIINALRIAPHSSHQVLEQSLEQAAKIKARHTYLIHMSHQIGLHDEIQQTLPADLSFAYDGLEIEVNP